jgi:hypothetical protein
VVCDVDALVIELDEGWEDKLEELVTDDVALGSELEDVWDERIEELITDDVELGNELEGVWDERFEELLTEDVELGNELDEGWEERLEELLTNDVELGNELNEFWEERLEELDSEIEVISEGIGMAHPDKINAKHGIAMPIHLKFLVVFINKVYRIQFKKKEFSASFVRSTHPSQCLNIESQVIPIVWTPRVLRDLEALNLVQQYRNHR